MAVVGSNYRLSRHQKTVGKNTKIIATLISQKAEAKEQPRRLATHNTTTSSNKADLSLIKPFMLGTEELGTGEDLPTESTRFRKKLR